MELDKLPDNSNFETSQQLERRINLEVADFFEVEPIMPEVTIYSDKGDLDRKWIETSDGKYNEAPDWLTAFTAKSGQIHILSSGIMPVGLEESSQIAFNKTLKHEIGHIYTDQINLRAAVWLSEGLSLYMADQDSYRIVNSKDVSIALLNELEHTPTDGRIYEIGRHMVDEIIAIGGKELLFKFTSIQDKDERNELLRATFSWLK